MITEQDKTFLRRAMRLAMNGRGHVEPNPMVGCVLVKNGEILGEGWHKKYGEAHAEPTALNDCNARGNDPSGATAYVTLEPCCHTNKQTPPCAPKLIQANIARVVIGCLDPNPEVNGKGVAMLRKAGIEADVLPGEKPSGPLSPVLGGEGQGEGESAGKVQVSSVTHATTPSPQPSPPGTGERESDASHFQQLIAPFILRTIHRRSYVTMKWAETADGRVADEGGKPLRISNDASNFFVHELRARERWILIGANTVCCDDPLLNARRLDQPRLVLRLILDPNLRTPVDARIITSNLDDGSKAMTYILTTDRAKASKPDKVAGYGRYHVRSIPTKEDSDGRIDLRAVAESQLDHDYFVEAGPTLARGFFDAGVCDRLIVIRSPNALGKSVGVPTAPPIPPHFLPVATLHLAGDVLTEYLNTQSPAFFAPVPSADFVLAQEAAGNAQSTGDAWHRG